MMVELDLAREPYSVRGSYFSLMQIPGDWAPLGKGLYIQTHHGGQAQAFRIDPVRGRRKVSYEVAATATHVTLTCKGGGVVTICIDPVETVRIQGIGVGLRLEAPSRRWCYAYPMPNGVWAVYIHESDWTFALDCLQGSMEMDAPWVKGKGFCKESERMVATCTPDRNGKLELAVDEFRSSWARPERPPFDACRKRVRQSLERFCRKLPAASKAMTETRDRAACVNWSAVLAPCGYLKRQTMLMSKAGMCHVYGWDHAFNAMAHIRHEPQLAWDQLMVMSDQQDRLGKAPDNMNDRRISYAFGKPPVQGWAAAYMMRRNPRFFTRERLRELYGYLSSASSWFLKYRVWIGDVLPFYTHGFDSGWDNSTIFDKGVPLVSPDLAAFLALQLEVAGEVAQRLNKKRDAARWQRLSREMIEGLLSTLWQDGQFVGLVKPRDEVVRCRSLITCMPIVLGRRLPGEVQEALVRQIRTFVTKWGLPTEHPDSPHYQKNGYWRGPIWAPSTMLIVSGLHQVGEETLARSLSREFLRMCKQSGFAENFDALSGKGHFCPSYTWTSSVFMMLAEQYAEA